MDTQKQKLLIEYLISSTDTFAVCQSIVEAKYFDPELRNAVAFIKKYFEKYSTTPNKHQILAESGVLCEEYEISRDEISYVAEEVEKFCREKAFENAVLKAATLVGTDQQESIESLMKEASLVSLQKDLGVRYYENIEERLLRMLNENPVHPTTWTDVDDALFGGISRKELLLVAANSGGGKSLVLSNLSYNFARTGMNVLYISLELSEDVVAQRFDTMHTGIGRRDWKGHISEIVAKVQQEGVDNGVIDIVQMTSGTTANKIRSYLKEYHLQRGMMPDLLVLDYLDKMSPNEKVDASDAFTKDKMCAEQLRDIGVDHNLFIATASQLNRSAVGATEHDHSQIAGGISKINESDVYWSIIMNESMRAAGEITFIFQKTRNSDGVGKIVHLNFDVKTLLITDSDRTSSKLDFKSKSSKLAGSKPGISKTLEDLVGDNDTPTTASGLLDLMN